MEQFYRRDPRFKTARVRKENHIVLLGITTEGTYQRGFAPAAAFASIGEPTQTGTLSGISMLMIA